MSYQLIKPLLFQMPAEVSHDLALNLLSKFDSLVAAALPKPIVDPVDIAGVRFTNRVGLAAGLDKNARCIKSFAAMGFGFIEVGTVTPKAQLGNPKPRMFRLKDHQAIINRMGFNNEGVDALVERVERLQAVRSKLPPLGINIGKNKVTEAQNAVNDYVHCLQQVAPFADYVTVNLSSPNTPGLRDLQFGEPLRQLLAGITEARKSVSQHIQRKIPLFVKVAPDMSDDDLRSVLDQLVEAGIEGVIATNTTIDKGLVADSVYADEAGGLSGRILASRSTEVVRTIKKHCQDSLAIIGVGGVDCVEAAQEKIEAGADAVQLYTGFIYQGPKLIRDVAAHLKDAKT